MGKAQIYVGDYEKIMEIDWRFEEFVNKNKAPGPKLFPCKTSRSHKLLDEGKCMNLFTQFRKT